jgi:hypothetical protein
MFTVANLGDATLTVPSGIASGSGTLLTGGFVFVNNMTGGPITLTLSAALTPFILLKDIAGNAATNKITITYPGGIDAVTSVKLEYAYARVWLVWNGADYSIIG